MTITRFEQLRPCTRHTISIFNIRNKKEQKRKDYCLMYYTLGRVEFAKNKYFFPNKLLIVRKSCIFS